jgi:hypothetical protein
MPDHAHLELFGMDDAANLQAGIRACKGRSAAALRRLGVRNLWQKGFYDHILRSGDNPDSVACYIFRNPVRKGLVGRWKDWPYSGSNVLNWKELPEPDEEFVAPWKT